MEWPPLSIPAVQYWQDNIYFYRYNCLGSIALENEERSAALQGTVVTATENLMRGA